jgi:hypothetical protein
MPRRKGRRSFGSLRRLPSGRWKARYRDAAGKSHTAPETSLPGAGPGRRLRRAAQGGTGRPAGQAGGAAASADHGGRTGDRDRRALHLGADQDRGRPTHRDPPGGGGRRPGRAPGHLQPARPRRAGLHLRRGWAAPAEQLQPAGVGPATRAAGLDGLHFHDLRHTSATLSIAAGASTRELMARMGHSSSAAALRYQHVLVGLDTAIAAALDELIEAASALAESPPSAPSGTRVARIGQSDKGRKRR